MVPVYVNLGRTPRPPFGVQNRPSCVCKRVRGSTFFTAFSLYQGLGKLFFCIEVPNTLGEDAAPCFTPFPSAFLAPPPPSSTSQVASQYKFGKECGRLWVPIFFFLLPSPLLCLLQMVGFSPFCCPPPPPSVLLIFSAGGKRSQI